MSERTKPDLRGESKYSNPTLSPLHDGQGVVKVNADGVNALVKKGILSEEQGKQILNDLAEDKPNRLYLITLRKVDGKMKPTRVFSGRVINEDGESYFRSSLTLNLTEPSSIPQNIPRGLLVNLNDIETDTKIRDSAGNLSGTHRILDDIKAIEDNLAQISRAGLDKALASANDPAYIPNTPPDYAGTATGAGIISKKTTLSV